METSQHIKSAYDPLNKKRYNQVIKYGKTRTKQSLADEADINHIIKRYANTSMLADLDKLESVYGEITSMDLLESHQKIMAAEEAFMEISSDIRKQFDNDPGKFIDYATNPENIDQMLEWKLAKLTPQSQALRDAKAEADLIAKETADFIETA